MHTKDIKEKASEQLKTKDNHTISKMPKSNQSLPPVGMAQSTLVKYYLVAQNLSDTKKSGKPTGN